MYKWSSLEFYLILKVYYGPLIFVWQRYAVLQVCFSFFYYRNMQEKLLIFSGRKDREVVI